MKLDYIVDICLWKFSDISAISGQIHFFGFAKARLGVRTKAGKVNDMLT